MTNMTLAIPEELHRLMQKYHQIKWSEVARQAMKTEAEKLELMNKLLAKSKLTEKDAIKIGKKVNRGLLEKHKLLR